MLQTACPGCQRSLRVSPRLAGRDATCPSCGTVFPVETLRACASPTGTAVAVPETAREDSQQKERASTAASRDLGRFQLIEVLGQGNFGRVYRAYDPQLDHMVALKVPTFGSDETGKVQRFLTEAKAAARLRHPNIVPVFECGRIGPALYISSQFIAGTTLAKYIETHQLDFRQTAKLVAAIARALAYAHQQGVVHRDVKPHNVMLDERGEPQVMDFGLAKRIDEDSALTTDSSILGTPAYMSPEQARGDSARAGPASDQYSVGVMLYEMLTGRRPFVGPPHLVVAHVAHRDPPPPRAVRPDIPPDLEAVCLKAMRKEPAARYPDAADMADDLHRWLGGVAINARRMGPLETVLHWRRRNPLVAHLVIAIVLVATTAFLAVSIALAQVIHQRQEAIEARRSAESARAEAERSAMLEQKQRGLAEQNLTEAHQQRTFAQQQAELARERLEQLKEEIRQREISDKDAAEQRARAEAAEQQGKLGRYLYLIDQISRSADERPDIARQSLADCESQYRSWEWAFLAASTQHDVWNLPPPAGQITDVSAGADSDRIAVCQARGPVLLYGPPDGEPAVQPTALSAEAAWSLLLPGAQRLLCGGKEPGMTLWDVPGTAKTAPALPIQHVIAVAALAPDGKSAATCASPQDLPAQQDQAIRVWDLTTGRVVRKLDGSGAPVTALAFNLTGELLASGDVNGNVSVREFASGRSVSSGQYRGRVRRMSFAPDSSRVLVITDNYDGITLINARTGRPQGVLPRRGVRVLDAAFSTDGLAVAALDERGQLFVWDAVSRDVRRVWTVERRATEEGLAAAGRVWHTGRGWCLAVADPSHLTIERLPRGTAPTELRVERGGVLQLDVRPDGGQCVAAADDGVLWSWERGAFAPSRLTPSETAPASCVAFSPRSNCLAVGRTDGSLALVEASSGTALREWKAHDNPVRFLNWSSDAERMVTSDERGEIRVWRAEREEPERTMSLSDATVMAIDWQPDGQVVAVGLDDASLLLWNLADPHAVNIVCRKGVGAVCCVRFHPAQNLVAAAGEDATIRLWDAQTGRLIREMQGHFGPVRDLTFTPSGDRLASVSDDRTLRLWEPETGLETFRTTVGTAGLKEVSFARDAELIYVRGGDGVIRVFDAGNGR